MLVFDLFELYNTDAEQALSNWNEKKVVYTAIDWTQNKTRTRPIH